MISKLRKNKEETKKKVKKHNYNINQDYNMSQDYNINQENSRSKTYTKLLKKYVKNTEKSLALKLTLKKVFFYGISSILVVLIILFVVIVIVSALNYDKLSSKNNVALILPLVSSLSTTLVAICKLPEIIAHYLFNPEEEKSIIEIIGKMQEYDIQKGKQDKDNISMSQLYKKFSALDDSMKDPIVIGSDVNETYEKIKTIKMPSNISSNRKNKSVHQEKIKSTNSNKQ